MRRDWRRRLPAMQFRLTDRNAEEFCSGNIRDGNGVYLAAS